MRPLEREVQYGRDRWCCLQILLLPSIILVAMDYSYWSYNTRTTCDVINDHYYVGSCDSDDLGNYNHYITFTQQCNGLTYSRTTRCVEQNSDSFVTGTTHRCWTNEECSIQALYFNHLDNWPFNMFLIPTMVLLLIATIMFIPLMRCSIKLYQKSAPRFWNTVSTVFYAPKEILLNHRVNTEYFMNGYFRLIQTNLRHVIVPFDIIKLCLDFYTINSDEFNQYTAMIKSPVRCLQDTTTPIQSVAERDILCHSSMKNAQKKRNVAGIFIICSCIICIVAMRINLFKFDFLIGVVGIIMGVCSVYSFLCHHYASRPQYYWKDCWEFGLYFDIKTKWVKHIKYVAHYGNYPNIHEPIVYTKNITNICEFKELTKISFDKDIQHSLDDYPAPHVEICILENNLNRRTKGIYHISHSSYIYISRRITQIMQRIDNTWDQRVVVELQ